MIELRKQDLFAEQQKALRVYYNDVVVGEYFADLFVNNFVIVELKATKQLNNNHQAQLMNYLKASNLQLGLLIISVHHVWKLKEWSITINLTADKY